MSRRSAALDPRRLLAPASTPHLERTADVIGCFINTLGLGWGAATAVAEYAQHQLTARDVVIIAVLLPLTAATTGWIDAAVLRRRPARTPLIVHTAFCSLQVLVFLTLWQGAPGQLVAPMTFSIELGAAAAWTCLSWPVVVFDLVFTVSLGGVVMARTGAMGPTHAFILNLGNSAFYGSIGVVVTMAWTAIVTVVGEARRAADASAASAAQLVASQEAAAASNRWDGIIHDHVLNALAVAAHWGAASGTDERVRLLARGALTALDRTSVGEQDEPLADRILRAAGALGLDADVDIVGDPPVEIAGRLLRATEEALTNVARHAGTRSVAISGRFAADHAELVVRDRGRGFDLAAVPEGRRGIATSIIGAMEVRGGRARIESVPGLGTKVTLAWDAPGLPTVRLAALGSFRAMVVFFFLTLAISLSLGWVEHGAVVDVALQIGLTAVLLGAVATAFAWKPLGRRAEVAITAVTVGCQAAMLGNLRPGVVLSWQEWFIGFGIGVFTPLAWRTASRRWVAVVAASWPVVTVAGALLGGSAPASMMWGRASSYTWPLILTFAAAWAADSMNRSLDAVASSRREALEAARERARTDAARHEAERRLVAIKGEPMEMLGFLASDGEVTKEVRRRCALLEASTRDLLVAPFIMSDAMRDAFRAARERGAAVTITGGYPVPEGCTGAADAFRRICGMLADVAGPGHRLTCRWHPSAGTGPDEGRDVATVALICDDEACGPCALRHDDLEGQLTSAVGRTTARLAVEDDEGDMLVTIGA